jgi:flagellar protein FliO/FliZ
MAAVADAAPQALPAAGASIGSVLLSLALVLVLIGGLAWSLRRLQFGRGGGTRLIQVVAQVPLGPRERVVLVRVGERQALLGVGPAGVTSLQLLDVEIESATTTAPVATTADPSAVLGRMRELLERGRGR